VPVRWRPQRPNGGTALRPVVGVEFAVGGAGVLGAVGAAAFVPVWICAVVGVHFLPLATVLRARLTRWLGVAVTTVSVAGLLVGVFSDTARAR
jgi:hypothetical protein